MYWIEATLGALFLGMLLLLLVHRMRKSEERFRLLAEHASDIIGLHDPEGRWVWVSPSVEKLLGYKPKELLGRSAYEFFHPDDTTKIREQAHAVVLEEKSGDRARVTFRMRRKDNSYVWLETLTRPVFDRSGEITGLVTASRDVSERRNAEDLYRFLVQHLPHTSVFLFDRHLRHRIAEGGLLTHTLAASSPEGKTLWEVFPQDIAKVLHPYYLKVLGGDPVQVEMPFRTRTYNIHFLPIRDALGNVLMGMAVFTDVTEERSTIMALEDQTKDLERSNKDLEQFANVASHELKAPLRRIAGFAELLNTEYQERLPAEAQEYLTHMTDGVETLRSVIESLLTYARVRTDRSRSQMEMVDATAVLREAVRNLAGMIRERHATVKSTPLPIVLADRGLLRQVFENLIGNAIKFNTTGRPPSVRVAARRDLMDWEFTVADNGPGIPPEDGAKVFVMFSRLHPEIEGTGIGLALVKKIMGIHRGRIWFEPNTPHGTTFKFTLPARSSPDEVTQP